MKTLTERAEYRVTVLAEWEAGRISKEAALASLQCSERHLRRLRALLLVRGPCALNHGNLGRLPWHAVDQALKERVLSIYGQKRYSGMNFHQFTEYLAEHEGILLSRPVVHRILRAAGIAPPRPQKRRCKHRKRRDRSAQEGHMLQLDASVHEWVKGLPKFNTVAAIDDATGRIWAGDRDHEDLQGYMELLQEICTTFGIPEVVYTDGLAAFGSKNTYSQAWKKKNLAQLQKVFSMLGIHHITAGSPQAKGRVERSFNTLQDRLISHFRFDDVKTMKAMRSSRSGYLRNHNKRFTVPATDPIVAWKPWPKELSPDEVFCRHHVRVVRNDNTITFNHLVIDLPPASANASRAKTRVDVLEHFDGVITVKAGRERLALVLPAKPTQAPPELQAQLVPATSSDRV